MRSVTIVEILLLFGMYIYFILSVHSALAHRVGRPLHNIPAPFPFVLDIFFVDLKLCLIHICTLKPCLSWSSNRSSALNSIHFFTQSSSSFLITWSYHPSLQPLMKVVIGSTQTSLLNSSFVLLSFNEIPHLHLIICISALSNFKPTSTSKGLVTLP